MANGVHRYGRIASQVDWQGMAQGLPFGVKLADHIFDAFPFLCCWWQGQNMSGVLMEVEQCLSPDANCLSQGLTERWIKHNYYTYERNTLFLYTLKYLYQDRIKYSMYGGNKTFKQIQWPYFLYSVIHAYTISLVAAVMFVITHWWDLLVFCCEGHAGCPHPRAKAIWFTPEYVHGPPPFIKFVAAHLNILSELHVKKDSLGHKTAIGSCTTATNLMLLLMKQGWQQTCESIVYVVFPPYMHTHSPIHTHTHTHHELKYWVQKC